MNLKPLVILIIDNLEGGYYHPEMKSKLKNGDSMLDSGETMYGLDRKHGKTLNTGADGVNFWNVIDMHYGTHHADTRYYNDKADGRLIPKAVGDELKTYIYNIMSAQLQKNAAMLSEGARKIVFNSPALTLQFLYACWNGSGNFQTFANVINAAYANGKKSAEAYWDLIQKERRKKGGLIAKGADILDNLKSKVENKTKKKWIVPILLGAALFFFLRKK